MDHRTEGATAVEPIDGGREQTVPVDDRYREAMAQAGRLLTSRPRTERELSERLASAGFEPPVVARVVQRLRELRLVDDADFVRRFIAERGGRKGHQVLLAELEAKGVAREAVESALDEAGPDEGANARALAEARLRRWVHLPLETQAARLYRFLAGRGFSEEIAEEAVTAVLPPEGWD